MVFYLDLTQVYHTEFAKNDLLMVRVNSRNFKNCTHAFL